MSCIDIILKINKIFIIFFVVLICSIINKLINKVQTKTQIKNYSILLIHFFFLRETDTNIIFCYLRLGS